ncbi:MAG TPA: glycoside hydrolase family 16 protein [Rhizomicrobium sp.]
MHTETHRSRTSARGFRNVALAAAAVCFTLHANASFAGKIDPLNLPGTAQLTFDDEFNTLSLWNGTTGTWDSNYWYKPPHGKGGSLNNNGEQEWYINSNYHKTKSVKPWKVSNGILTLTGNHAAKNIRPLIHNYKYTSGEINSWQSFSQEYGYFEIRCKLPRGQGTWPAFWLLPENGEWPPEIDILEVLGNDPTTLYTSAHYELHGQEHNPGAQIKVPDTSKAFHTYGVDWEPGSLTWYFDGQQVYTLTTKKGWGFDTPMYIETNLALGGYWPGKVDKTTPFPSRMEVDYIRVYTSKP